MLSAGYQSLYFYGRFTVSFFSSLVSDLMRVKQDQDAHQSVIIAERVHGEGFFQHTGNQHVIVQHTLDGSMVTQYEYSDEPPKSNIQVHSSLEHPSLLPFRDLGRKLVQDKRRSASLPLMQSVTAVGMPFCDEYGFMYRRDVKSLTDTVVSLGNIGLALDPHFQLRPMDLRQGRDFLDPKNNFKTDVLMIAMIAGADHVERKPYRGKREMPNALLQSPYEKGMECWREATMRIRPKVVFSYFGTGQDIKGSDFLDSLDYISGPYCPDATGLARMCHIRQDFAEEHGL